MITSKPRFLTASLLLSGIGMSGAWAQVPNPWSPPIHSPPARSAPPPSAMAKQAQPATPATVPNPLTWFNPVAAPQAQTAPSPATTAPAAPANPWSAFFPPAPVTAPQVQAQPVPAPSPSYTLPPVPTFTPPPVPPSTYVQPPIPVITLPALPGFAPPQAASATPPAPPAAKTEETPPVPAPSLERLGKSLQNYFTEDEIKLLFEYMQESVLAAFNGEEVVLAPDLAFKLEVLYVRIQKEGNLYMSQLMQQLKHDLDKAIKEQLGPKPPPPQNKQAPAKH